MFTSADLLLIEVAGVFLPAFIVTVFTIAYSYKTTVRYKRAIKRLYQMGFKGVDMERRRIASEMHDHLAEHSITVAEEFIELKKRLTGEDLELLKKIETNADLFRFRTHQIVEYMYPRGLFDSDWQIALQQLAGKMSIGNVRVTFESFAENAPKNDWLHHTYWAIQEIVANAIRHSKVNRVQITATEEQSKFILCIHYRATEKASNWLTSKVKAGLGTLIVQDRLQIVGAELGVEIKDNVITHTVSFKK
jgi:signal transduction histidine kinase